MLCCWLLIVSLLGQSLAEDGLMLEGDVTSTGEVYEVFGSGGGAFVLTLMASDKYYMMWGSNDGTKNIQCTIDKTVLPLNVLFLDSWADKDTLYILNSVSSQVYLHSFWITNSSQTCNTLTQLSYTPKGKILYGFLLPRGTDLLVSVVDSKRDWYFALLPPSSPTAAAPPTWTQTRSLIDVDAEAGDTTGSTNNKAIPSHFYLQKDEVLLFLDKTGKAYTTSLAALFTNLETSKFVSLVYAPTSSVTYIRTFFADGDLGLAAVAQVEATCNSNLHIFRYSQAISTGVPQSYQYIGQDDGQKCDAFRVISDGVSLFFQNGQEIIRLIPGSSITSTVFFPAQTGVGILDFKVLTSNALIIVGRNSLGTVIYRGTGTNNPDKYNEGVSTFTWGNILRWDVVRTGATYDGTLWYSKTGLVYGTGFGDSSPLRISVARDAAKDYIDVNMAAAAAGFDATNTAILGFNNGDGDQLEVIRVAKWDYSDLSLPLDGSAPGGEVKSFRFEDFITALTRVKNDARATFNKDEIKYVSEWTPQSWSEETGLELDIFFNDGVKLLKTEQILNTIANELEVIIERECEYRDFLACDSIDISMTYTVTRDSTTSRKRVIEEKVVFQVIASAGLFVPSVVLSVLVALFLALI